MTVSILKSEQSYPLWMRISRNRISCNPPTIFVMRFQKDDFLSVSFQNCVDVSWTSFNYVDVSWTLFGSVVYQTSNSVFFVCCFKFYFFKCVCSDVSPRLCVSKFWDNVRSFNTPKATRTVAFTALLHVISFSFFLRDSFTASGSKLCPWKQGKFNTRFISPRNHGYDWGQQEAKNLMSPPQVWGPMRFFAACIWVVFAYVWQGLLIWSWIF